jgi:hypothetical protein
VGEREEEVGRIALRERRVRHDRVGDRPVVRVREEAALRRSGRARGVDVEADVVRRDGLVARLPFRLVAAAAALAELVERERVAKVRLGRVHDDDVLELRAAVLDRAHLGELLAVLDEDRP